MEERRKHPRIHIHTDDAVIIPELAVNSLRFLDVSEGGLSFLYVGWEEWPEREVLIDIIAENTPFIEGLRARSASDTKTEQPTVRRAGFQFGELTEEQREAVSRFVAEHGG